MVWLTAGVKLGSNANNRVFGGAVGGPDRVATGLAALSGDAVALSVVRACPVTSLWPWLLAAWLMRSSLLCVRARPAAKVWCDSGSTRMGHLLVG